MKLVRTLVFAALASVSGVAFAAGGTTVAGVPTAHAAHALKVSKSVTIDASADDVWAKVKNFDGINTWHPAFAKDEITSGKNNEPGAQRLLTMGDGGTIKEKLLKFDDKNRSFTYEILDGVLPVSHYTSTMSVKPAGKGKSTATWSSTFQRKNTGPNPGPTEDDATAEKTVSGAYQAGLDNLKKISEAK